MAKRKPKPKLSPDALEAYNQFSADAVGIVTAADRAALILLSEAWTEMREAEKEIAANGTVIKLPNGYPGPNPFCKTRNEARACVIKLLTELGLTPNSRARVKKSEAEPDKDDEDFGF